MSSIIPARHRRDLRYLSDTVVPLAGGSELFGAPRVELHGLVDLMTLGWPSLVTTRSDGARGADPDAVPGLEIAATCTLAELSRLPAEPGWAAHPLFFQCCTALFGSFKIWNVATVGGNLCLSLPAGPMTTLAAALDAEVLIWRRDGGEERMSAAAFVTGNGTNALRTGDVLRSIHLPAASLAAETAYRKIALSPLGRSGAVLVGRLDQDGTFLLTVTAATIRPVQLRYPALPEGEELRRDIAGIDLWLTDAHGSADWRRAVSGTLGAEILEELRERAAGPEKLGTPGRRAPGLDDLSAVAGVPA